MGKAGHGIFVDAGARCKKSRNEIDAIALARGGDHHSTSPDLAELAEIGGAGTQSCLRFHRRQPNRISVFTELAMSRSWCVGSGKFDQSPRMLLHIFLPARDLKHDE